MLSEFEIVKYTFEQTNIYSRYQQNLAFDLKHHTISHVHHCIFRDCGSAGQRGPNVLSKIKQWGPRPHQCNLVKQVSLCYSSQSFLLKGPKKLASPAVLLRFGDIHRLTTSASFLPDSSFIITYSVFLTVTLKK